MTQILPTAIERVYAAFAQVKKPRTIEGCPCCIDEKEVSVLLSKPLREISSNELSAYASSVFLTVGDKSDFRYLLPRILEISAIDPSWWPDPEIIARALTTAGWREWCMEEQDAIVQLFNAVFDQSLRSDDGAELDSRLCALASCELELAPYLGKIAASRSSILSLYKWNADSIVRDTLTNGFWDECLNARKEVLEWFYSVEISLTILATYGVDLNLPRSKQL